MNPREPQSSSGLTQEQLEAEIRRAVEADNKGAADALIDEWDRTYSSRAKAAAAIRDLDVAIGRAFLSIPGMSWLFRKLHLTPKEKYGS